jgi:hypothetical protein
MKKAIALIVLAACSDGTTSPPASGGFQVTVSGEELAVSGYPATEFVDGWEVRFEHVILTVANVRINADPDKDPGDPTLVGAELASVAGPFAVDVTIGGSVPGKSGEKTVAIATIDRQRNGDPFDPKTRYAFSYDLVRASATATLTNLDDAGRALYEEAKSKGWSTIFQGTATYRGAAPVAGSVFAKMPSEVRFKLGFTNPSAYLNCANTDFAAIGDEYPRGIQASVDKPTIAQITMHTDHLFWSKLNVEGTELHFDPIAGQASTFGTAGAPGLVTTDDLVGVDISGFKTRNGEPLPARSFSASYSPPAGTLSFDPNQTTFARPNSFAAFLGYTAAAGGHLNAAGECAIRNDFTP